MRSISHKTLLNENVDKSSVPNFSPEEIGHILLTIGKGIIKGPMQIPVFEDKKYEVKEFPVNFKNLMEGTRKDIIFFIQG